MARDVGWQHAPTASQGDDDDLYASFLHEVSLDDNPHPTDRSSEPFYEPPVVLPSDVPLLCTSSTFPLPVSQSTCTGSKALHALNIHLCIHAISRTDFYKRICAVTPDLLGPDAPLRAHTDGGSMATTTNRREYLWGYRALSAEEQRPVLRVADSRAHHPVGVGFLRVPTRDSPGYRLTKCFYTPSLPATILSPSSMAREHRCTAGYTTTFTFDGKDCCVNLVYPGNDRSADIVIPQVLLHDLLFTLPLERNPDAAPQPIALGLHDPCSVPPSTNKSTIISALTQDQLRVLWHQRLGHMHSRRVATAYKYASGIPKVPIASELESCPVCIRSKLRKAARSKESSRHADRCNQGISIDFGFIVQDSKKSESSSSSSRRLRLQGLHGETCYCLITDHYSGYLYGECFQSKSPPLEFLNRWLAQYGLSQEVSDKYVRFDQGGELGRCGAVLDLFSAAGYQVETTAADSSHQNGPGERPHQTIADGMRTMLAGAALPMKFWPYAFHHFLRIYNATVHADHDASPFEICSGSQPDLSLLRVFGCRVYALPARPRRPDKLISDARVGIFLGYARTMKNVLYFDELTETVKAAQHVAFDEAMHDVIDKSPNARLLGFDPTAVDPDLVDMDSPVGAFDISITPFAVLSTVRIRVEPGAEFPLGFEFCDCSSYHRAFISRIDRPCLSSSLTTFRRKYTGSYIVAIDGTPTFSSDSIHKLVTDLCASSSSNSFEIDILLAPERRADVRAPNNTPLHLRLHDLRRICALQSITPDASSHLSPADLRRAIDHFESLLTNHDMAAIIHRLQTDCMIPEERLLQSFTRRNLQKLPNWSEWDAAFDAQLDAHFAAGALGLPVPRPPSTSDGPANVLRIQWSNVVKPNGKRKCRACIDGSKRAAPWLHQFAQTYASCIEQPCMRLFFALAATNGLIVTFADTANAFQQSPPPTRKCYLQIDDAYASWYFKRHGHHVDRHGYVVPVERALQGHPEAGRLWETMIVDILSKRNFTSTTHERNLYHGTIDGSLVLVCRQIDDYAIASISPDIANRLIEFINSHATTENHGVGQSSSSGITNRYNGLDVHQTRQYIKLNCEVYIQRILQTHGWETPQARESDRHDCVPLSPDTMSSLALLSGPDETSPDHLTLERSLGFSYRQVLGELTYAYVICRLDIGFAVTFLARFALAPHQDHYLALKNVVRYLRRTIDWGLVYWRPSPISELPAVPLDQPSIDPSLPSFPASPLDQLVGFVDASYAADPKTRRSITGIVFCYAGAAIAYKSKLQTTVATSSTESEFYAAVHAAKIAKYLRSVLDELGFPCQGPTPLFEDNQAAIAMVNECRPTPRVRHLDIQHFAIQEWRARGIIQLFHIPGVINAADQQTKPLSFVLHSRHARPSMGHYGPPC